MSQCYTAMFSLCVWCCMKWCKSVTQLYCSDITAALAHTAPHWQNTRGWLETRCSPWWMCDVVSTLGHPSHHNSFIPPHYYGSSPPPLPHTAVTCSNRVPALSSPFGQNVQSWVAWVVIVIWILSVTKWKMIQIWEVDGFPYIFINMKLCYL